MVARREALRSMELRPGAGGIRGLGWGSFVHAARIASDQGRFGTYNAGGFAKAGKPAQTMPLTQGNGTPGLDHNTEKGRNHMRLNSTLGVLAIALALVGCAGTAPILNVADSPATSASGKPLSRDQVRTAIVRAGASLGWQMKDEGPNVIVGTLQLRTHTAVVEIPFSPTAYSVRYRSSTGLDEKAGNIHKNYNGWIQNLTRGINAQLSAS